MVISKIYAQVLFELANEDNCLDLIFSDLKFARQNVFNNQQFLSLFLNPNIKFADKSAIIKKIFTDNKLLVNFFLVMLQKNRFAHVNSVIEIFFNLYNKSQNILNASIRSAVPLSQNVLTTVQDILEKKFHATIVLENIIDKNVLGGFIVKIDETLIDLSISSYLANFKKYLFNLNLQEWSGNSL